MSNNENVIFVVFRIQQHVSRNVCLFLPLESNRPRRCIPEAPSPPVPMSDRSFCLSVFVCPFIRRYSIGYTYTDNRNANSSGVAIAATIVQRR